MEKLAMADIQLTIAMPESLVERAEAVGMDIHAQSEEIVAIFEREITRKEAAQRLAVIAEQMRGLNDNPTPDEIEAEIRDVRAERATKRPISSL
jgi:hypothetical protein